MPARSDRVGPVDRAEAAELLRVSIDAQPEAIRDAYRGRIRTEHPDVAGTQATARAARLNEAYDLLRQPLVDRPRASVTSRPATFHPAADPEPHRAAIATDVIKLIDDDTVGFTFPADEVFPLLVDVADDIGEISYVDANCGILETIVAFEGEPVCSVLLSLQGRSDQVEAFCTIEALDGSAAPPTSAVVDLLLRRLRSRLDG